MTLPTHEEMFPESRSCTYAEVYAHVEAEVEASLRVRRFYIEPDPRNLTDLQVAAFVQVKAKLMKEFEVGTLALRGSGTKVMIRPKPQAQPQEQK